MSDFFELHCVMTLVFGTEVIRTLDNDFQYLMLGHTNAT
jgi:hypothetical protein